MKRNLSVILASLVTAAVLVLASLVPASGGLVVRAKTLHAASCVTKPAPKFIGATKKYRGQSLIYYGDAVGCGHDMDVAAIKRFTKDTGIHVRIVEKPSDSDQAYAAYERLFNAHSSKIDVMMLDVVWPSAFANNLMNLKSQLGKLSKKHYATIVANDTVKGRLVAMPWFGDFGMLYYRTDLLKKYGYSGPPTTWDELTTMARKIQAGEQKKNKSFYGFVFQGKAYEGLTCDSLEWLASSGGGTIVQNGKVTLDNPNAAKIFDLARSWVGTISPKDVTTYTETESNTAFDNGDAAFLRNWPYAYALGQKAPAIAGKFNVAPLPHGPGGHSVGTVGGWQLGVSKYSKHPQAAMELVRYLTSPEVETWRAVVASFVPTIPSVARKSSVVHAMPFLGPMGAVTRVTRPSRFFGTRYNQASNIYWQGVSQILAGTPASQVLPATAHQLQRLMPNR